jgi:hypothetical protein
MISVTGDDLELLKTPGFDKTGYFPIYAAGPTCAYFNFADADEACRQLPMLFWLGKQFGQNRFILENQEILRKSLRRNDEIDPFNLIWYQPVLNGNQNLPATRLFSDINVLFMRSDWAVTSAVSIACKGGSNQADHAHLDLGSFVFDMNGTRWAYDLGRDNYDLPGYFDLSEGGGRWNYFRLNTYSHNTLVINGDNQRATAHAEFMEVKISDDEASGTLNLSEAYIPHATSVYRTFRRTKNSAIIVEDIIQWAGIEKHIQWQMLTDAEISLSGPKAELRKKGKRICAQILQPEKSVFEVISAEQKEPEHSNVGFRQLIIRKEETGETTTIIVSFCVIPCDI